MLNGKNAPRVTVEELMSFGFSENSAESRLKGDDFWRKHYGIPLLFIENGELLTNWPKSPIKHREES